MSEESSILDSSTEIDKNPKHGTMKDDGPKPVLHSDQLSIENAEMPAEKGNVQQNRPPEQNRQVLGSLESHVEETQSSRSEHQLSASTEIKSLESTNDVTKPAVKTTTSDASTEIKSPERARGVDQPALKSTAYSEISTSQAPSDKVQEGVTEDMQLVNEGLKDLKIGAQEIPGSASAKKGRKTPAPRAKSTPVKLLTSPPLTRSRSRDMRKFPSTPASPSSSAGRKNSESDSEEIRDARGRRKVKKN